MGMVHAYQKGEMPDASSKVRSVAGHIEPGAAKDFASTKHKGLPEHKSSSVGRLFVAGYILKVADFRTALGGAEKALHKVQEVRNKSMQEFSKNLQKENDNLRKEVESSAASAQAAADSARNVQSSSQAAQAMQMQTPGITPPAAQPPYGAMAVGPATEGTEGQQSKPAVPSMPSGPATI